jgi:methanethiol S-methyltransferase
MVRYDFRNVSTRVNCMSALILFLALTCWAVLHSLLATTWVKAATQRRFGDAAGRYYRLGYNVFAALSLLPVLALLRRLPDSQLYAIPYPFVLLTLVLQAIAATLAALAVMETGAMAFLGIHQLTAPDSARELVPSKKPEMRGDRLPLRSARLTTRGLYAWVRHPIYAASLVFIWLAPVMTVNLLALNCAMTLYFVVGARLEEQRLVAEWGDVYARYQAHVPMIVPRPPKGSAIK